MVSNSEDTKQPQATIQVKLPFTGELGVTKDIIEVFIQDAANEFWNVIQNGLGQSSQQTEGQASGKKRKTEDTSFIKEEEGPSNFKSKFGDTKVKQEDATWTKDDKAPQKVVFEPEAGNTSARDRALAEYRPGGPASPRVYVDKVKILPTSKGEPSPLTVFLKEDKLFMQACTLQGGMEIYEHTWFQVQTRADAEAARNEHCQYVPITNDPEGSVFVSRQRINVSWMYYGLPHGRRRDKAYSIRDWETRKTLFNIDKLQDNKIKPLTWNGKLWPGTEKACIKQFEIRWSKLLTDNSEKVDPIQGIPPDLVDMIIY